MPSDTLCKLTANLDYQTQLLTIKPTDHGN
jgi:hypothetical protein